eukprot:344537-Chlamydomonas_euryale.AAC.1
MERPHLPDMDRHAARGTARGQATNAAAPAATPAGGAAPPDPFDDAVPVACMASGGDVGNMASIPPHSVGRPARPTDAAAAGTNPFATQAVTDDPFSGQTAGRGGVAPVSTLPGLDAAARASRGACSAGGSPMHSIPEVWPAPGYEMQALSARAWAPTVRGSL